MALKADLKQREEEMRALKNTWEKAQAELKDCKDRTQSQNISAVAKQVAEELSQSLMKKIPSGMFHTALTSLKSNFKYEIPIALQLHKLDFTVVSALPSTSKVCGLVQRIQGVPLGSIPNKEHHVSLSGWAHSYAIDASQVSPDSFFVGLGRCRLEMETSSVMMIS